MSTMPLTQAQAQALYGRPPSQDSSNNTLLYQYLMSQQAGQQPGLAQQPATQTAPRGGGSMIKDLISMGRDIFGDKAKEESANQIGQQITSQGGSQLAQTAAENEAYNAAATQAASPTIMGNFGSMGFGPQSAIVATTALAGKSAWDMLHGKKDNSLSGKFGRGSLAVATGGLSEVGNKLFNKKPKTNVEGKRLEELKKQGKLDSNFSIPADEKRNRSQQLKDIESGKGTGNKDWLRTGDEKYLTAQDIQGYAGLLEKEKDAGKRLQLAQRYVDEMQKGNKLFDEHHGTIDFKDFNTQVPTNDQKINRPLMIPKQQSAFRR